MLLALILLVLILGVLLRDFDLLDEAAALAEDFFGRTVGEADLVFLIFFLIEMGFFLVWDFVF